MLTPTGPDTRLSHCTNTGHTSSKRHSKEASEDLVGEACTGKVAVLPGMRIRALKSSVDSAIETGGSRKLL